MLRIFLSFYPISLFVFFYLFFFFASRRRHTIYWRDWSSYVCSSDLGTGASRSTSSRVVTAEDPYPRSTTSGRTASRSRGTWVATSQRSTRRSRLALVVPRVGSPRARARPAASRGLAFLGRLARRLWSWPPDAPPPASLTGPERSRG